MGVPQSRQRYTSSSSHFQSNKHIEQPTERQYPHVSGSYPKTFFQKEGNSQKWIRKSHYLGVCTEKHPAIQRIEHIDQ